MRKQRVIIADGSRFFREGLKSILLNIGDVIVVAEAESGTELLRVMENEKADIVFLDVVLPGLGGFEAAMAGHREYPATRFIAFTALENPRYLQQMIMAGVSGYLIKSCDNHELLHAIIHDDPRLFYLSPDLQKNALHFENNRIIN